MAHIGAALPKVANAIKKAFNPDGLNIIQNNGEVRRSISIPYSFPFLATIRK